MPKKLNNVCNCCSTESYAQETIKVAKEALANHRCEKGNSRCFNAMTMVKEDIKFVEKDFYSNRGCQITENIRILSFNTGKFVSLAKRKK